jgi:uncharacterized protein YaiL (DUF2058 family)
MSSSLRDQLLALGVAKKTEAKTQFKKPDKAIAARPKPNALSNPQKNNAIQAKNAEPNLAQAYALRARTEREEQERVLKEAQEQARIKRERKEKLSALLKNKALNQQDAEHARHFNHGKKIRRIYVTAEQLTQLNLGELGVVQLAGRYLLVDRETALAAQTIATESLILLPDPNAAAEDDIPADLMW